MVLAAKDFVSPPDLVATTAAFFGGEIELDPASSEEANQVVQANKFFNWRQNGLLQTWKSKNIYLYPPRDIAHKSDQPKSKILWEKPKYFKKSNQTVWLEMAYSKWMRKEFDEGIIFLTSTEVALITTQRLGFDLPMCVLKEHPRLLEDDAELKPIKNRKAYGFVFYLPSVTRCQERTHEFHQQYSDLGRVYA